METMEKTEIIKVLEQLGVGFGNLIAMMENISLGYQPKLSDHAESLVCQKHRMRLTQGQGVFRVGADAAHPVDAHPAVAEAAATNTPAFDRLPTGSSDTVRRQLFTQTETAHADAEIMPIPIPQRPTIEAEDKPVTQASKKEKYERKTTSPITWCVKKGCCTSIAACKIASINTIGKTLAMFCKHDPSNESIQFCLFTGTCNHTKHASMFITQVVAHTNTTGIRNIHHYTN
ncbi:inter-alpha-trypsin inhibitor heavy chain-related protein [Artemisia annua]|uniref:Inter-alpha-trypsin inhibitor heavy chain-related protein n=1 Tax=Artemisia annua TaxID=35608 RepID=A0A2U1KJ17_ARTAN|nr:inter-alpha-trypsin inhibitor heavy chain-related protein [Artemisia annua]